MLSTAGGSILSLVGKPLAVMIIEMKMNLYGMRRIFLTAKSTQHVTTKSVCMKSRAKGGNAL
jgi:hypothetical protein